ncbi:MAG: D-aminoacylase [Candidatus Cloacimonetes bacterium]|nr:D-aminoacylase [Candidatus Cloacimonadota bacterium]
MKRRTFLRHTGAALGAATLGPAFVRGAAAESGRAALLLRGAVVYDGTGAAPFEADVLVADGRIREIGRGLSAAGAEEVQLDGLALSPGFVDIHSHTSTQVLTNPRAESKLLQGVTTEVAGQDGSSVGLWSDDQFEAVRERYRRDGVELQFRDVAGFLAQVDRQGAALNIASMVGAGSIRAFVVGADDRPASVEETARMRALVEEAIAGGACGLSSGLEYTPGGFASTDELIALASALRGTGLPYASHMRNEDDRLLAAIEEAIRVGQGAGVPVQVSHLKAQGQRNWWKADQALGLIEAARAAGIDVMFDVYPYIAYSTGLSNLFPIDALDGGTEAFRARLRDPAHSDALREAVLAKVESLGSWDAVQITSTDSEEYAFARGKRLGALAAQRRVEPYDLLVEILLSGGGGMVGFGMSEENVRKFLVHPLAMICSDGGAYTIETSSSPHPRNFGTFPRVLGHYVREEKLMPLETAIHKVTMMPARRIGVTDRGTVERAMAADLVVFDPAVLTDRATFEQPKQYATGIRHVIVNGTFVLRDGEYTGAYPGRAVRPTRAAHG